jgi:hypothetical protein
MKPFDLEAAKRGEPIECDGAVRCVEAHFVGVSNDGRPVVQVNGINFGSPFIPYYGELRMAPKTLTVRYRNYLMREEDGNVSVCTANDLYGHSSPATIEMGYGFIKWIHTDWQTAEIKGDE